MPVSIHQLALTFLDSIGPVTARNLVSYCGSAEAIFQEKKSQLLKIPGIGPFRAGLENMDEALRLAEDELSLIERHGVQTFFYLDEHYPSRLKHFPDSPLVLYGRGHVSNHRPRTLAVVGTRKPTEYGKIKCRQLINELADTDVTILSGLAYGIDAIAHQASVQVGLKTIGVLGNGLPNIYPATNRKLVEHMIAGGGGVVSQFHINAKPDRECFPMRNRTVAYMADATLVIESQASGGSMITANFAFHNNRELFALPGRTTDPTSEGCLKLIKANMAQLVTCGEDIIKAMFWDVKKTAPKQQTLFADLEGDEKRLVDEITVTPQIHIDELADRVNLAGSKLASVLLQLELKRVIAQLPGKRFAIVC